MQKKMTMCKKDDKQNSKFFIASKWVGLSSDIWPSRKTLKGSLQNIYLMLDLYCKGNPLITAVVDDSIFSKIFKTILERKMLEEDITFIRVLQ